MMVVMVQYDREICQHASAHIVAASCSVINIVEHTANDIDWIFIILNRQVLVDLKDIMATRLASAIVRFVSKPRSTLKSKNNNKVLFG